MFATSKALSLGRSFFVCSPVFARIGAAFAIGTPADFTAFGSEISFAHEWWCVIFCENEGQRYASSWNFQLEFHLTFGHPNRIQLYSFVHEIVLTHFFTLTFNVRGRLRAAIFHSLVPAGDWWRVRRIFHAQNQ